MPGRGLTLPSPATPSWFASKNALALYRCRTQTEEDEPKKKSAVFSR